MNINIKNSYFRILLGILIVFLSLLLFRLLTYEYFNNIYDFILIIGILTILLALSLHYNIKKVFYAFIFSIPIIIFLGRDRFIYMTFFEESFLFFVLIWLVKTFYLLKPNDKTKFRLNNADIAFILFSIFALISAIWVLFKDGNLDLLFSLNLEKFVMTWQGQPFYPIRRVFVIFEGLLAYIFVRVNIEIKELKDFKPFIAYSSLIFAGVALYDYFFRDLTVFYHGFNRVNSVFANPNVYGTYAAMTLPFVLSWLVEKGKSKINYFGRALVFLICLSGLVLSYSKGAWLGAFLSILLFLGFYYKKFIIKNKKIILIGLVALIVLLFTFLAYYFYLHTPLEIQRASHGRFYIWSAGLNMISYDPFFGIGSGLFYKDLGMYYPEGIRPWTEHEHAHNLFIHNFAEFGIIGGSLLSFVLIGLFVSLFYRIKEVSVESAAVFCAVFAVLIHSLIDYTLLSSVLNVIFWIFVGIGYNLLEQKDYKR